MQLATYIRSRRKNLNMTQKELAEKVGVSMNTVARWERGETEPSFSDFLKLCAVLGMNPMDFMDIQKTSDIPGVKTITVPKLNFENVMTYEEYTRNVGRLEKENGNDE